MAGSSAAVSTGVKVRRGARQRRGEIERAIACAVERQHQLEIGQVVANLGDAFDALRIGDQRGRAGILQAIAERIDAEQHRQRQRDAAELVDRDMAGRHFRRLRQQDGDAVAARNAVRAQHIGEPVGGLAQPAVGDGVFAPVRPRMQDGEPVGLERRPAVADIDADIVARRHLPAELAIDVVVVVRGEAAPAWRRRLVSGCGEV